MNKRVHLNRLDIYRINAVQVILNRMQFYLDNANGIYCIVLFDSNYSK